MTRFTDLVGCRFPIQLAAMTRVVSPQLAAAVSNAGGLGMLAIGKSSSSAAIATLDAARQLASSPVGAGFIVEFLNRDALDAVAERVPVVEFFWGWPDPSIVPPNVVSGWQVGSADEARAAADAGCSFVVAQGIEGGGHVRSSITLAELLPAVLDAVDIPVVAAGGIGSATDVRSALAAGADAVRIGTRFVAALESAAHPQYVDGLIRATAADTVVTEAFDVGWPNAPHRVLRSALDAALAADDGVIAVFRNADGSTADLPRFSTTPPVDTTVGNIDAMALYAGMSVDDIHRRDAAADVMVELLAGLDRDGRYVAKPEEQT